MFSRYKSVSPLIATILLIVVSVIIVTIILTWGKSFVSDNLFSSSTLSTNNTDRYNYIRLIDIKNGRFFFNYSPPHTITDHNFTITSYTYNGGHIILLPEEKTITSPGSFTLDLGIVDTDSFYINLIFSDNFYLPFKDLTTTNISPTSLDCPSGFIPVPGNHLYGTVYSKGGFCVAQYEMKMDANGDGIGDKDTIFNCNYNSTYNIWDYSKAGCSTGTIVSTAEGSPIVMITQYQSVDACESIGGHLITNEEWMTLVRNIELVKNNWSGGEIGSGYLPRGNSDNNQAMSGFDELSEINKRTLILTNGEVIWDLGSNVFSWINGIFSLNLDTLPNRYNDNNEPLTNGGWFSYSYRENDQIGSSWAGWHIKSNNLGSNSYFKYKDLFLLSSGEYNIDNGVGRIYLNAFSNRSAIRGGNWYDGEYNGILAIHFFSPNTAHPNFSFRCSVVP